MNDDQGKATGEQPVRLVSKPAGNPLGFSLEFRENAALVTLRDRVAPGGIRIESLELEVPDVRFPFDVAGGAEQFRHRRCRLRMLVASIEQAEVAHVLGGLLDPARYGLGDLRLDITEGQGVLSGTWKTGGARAPFTLRFVAEAGDQLEVRVHIHDLRVFGPLPLPATALVTQVGRALQAVRARLDDGCVLMLRPVQDLVRWLLPAHGWKVPDLDGLRLDRVELHGGRMRLVTARYPDELPPASGARDVSSPARASLDRRVLVFKEGVGAYREAERALAEGRLEEARKLFLGKDGVEPAHPHAARRMLEIGAVRPERFDEVEDLVRDLLAANADFLPALFARAAICERRGGERDLGRAAEAFRRIGDLAAANRELPDAVLAHMKAGQLFEGVDDDQAIASYERVLELDPDHLHAMRILTRLYEQGSRWYRALRMNLRYARRLEDPVEVSGCHLRMGNVFLDRFDDLDRARKHFSAALTHDPNNLDALSSQAIVHQRQGHPARAARLLLRLIELADPARHQQQILATRLRLARLWQDELDDPATALLHYERILADQPEHLEALHKVGLIAAEQQNWEQAASAFSRLLEMEAGGVTIPDEVIRSCCLALGRIYGARPDGRTEARAHLRRAAELGEDDLSAWSALEKIEREEQAWPGLVEVLERKADLLQDEEAVLACVLEAARICDRRLGDRARAEVFYRRALGIEPSSAEALDGLLFVLRDEGRIEELEAVLVEAAGAEPDPRRAAAYWDRIAALRTERMDDVPGGLQALERAVQLDPDNPATVERLLASYRAQHDLEAFVELVGRVKDGVLPGEKLVDVWLERARILEEQLDRREEAIESYQRALELEPELLQAHRALADLYFEQGMWAQAREAVERVLQTAGDAGLSGPGGTELYRRLAEVEIRLGNPAAAIDQLRQVLSRYPDDREAADRLSRLLREEERWEELAAFYAQRAEHATGERAAALHTAAATIWWEKLKKLAPAATQYQLAVESAPRSEACPARLASLQRVYVGLGRWMDVVGVLEQRVAFCRPEEKAPMYLAMAAILSSRIDDPEAAAVCWTRALQVDPGHRPSLLMLARHRFEQGAYQEAIELGRRALADDGAGPVLPAERRAAVALDAARSAWVLERFDDAVEMYQEHMESFAPRQYSGVDPEALERLELLLRKQRRYPELALLYRRWLGAGATPDRRPGLRRALALLLFEHLDQPDEAIEVLSAHVHDKPDDQPAVADLLDMLRASSRWEHLVHLLRVQWDQAPTAQGRMDRLEELADTLQRRLHQPEAAIPHWQTLMDEGHGMAAERLAGLYRQEGMHRELAELLRDRAMSCEQPGEASAVFGELGQLAAESLGDVSMALDAYRRAYQLVPSLDNQETILTLLREKGAAGELGEFLLACAEEEEDPQRQRALLLEHAELCMTRLQQHEQAVRSLRRAVEIEADEASVHRCQALYEEDQDWAGVADMQELLVDLAEESSTAARRLHRLGRVFLINLQAPERAKAAFERAAELDPSWLAPLVDLGRILSEEEDWENLLALKLRLAEVTTEDDDRAEHLHQAAGLAFERIGDAQHGVDLLQRAVDVSSDPIPWLSELAERCEQAGQYAQAADAVERMVSGEREIGDTTETPAGMFRRLAELRSQAGDDDAAIAAFERALRLEPSDEATAERLEAIYRRQARHTDLAMMLEDLAGRKSRNQAADSWVAAARSWLDAGDPKAAGFALDKALAVQPDHREASVMTLDLLGRREEFADMLRVLQGLPAKLLEVAEVARAVRACFGHMLDAGDDDQQLAACRLMLRLDPDDITALDRLAGLLQEGGDADEAEAVLRKLDEHADALAEERRYELDFTLASIDFSRGQLEEAERRLKACSRARPADPAPREFLHKIYTGGKRFADQVALLLDEAARSPQAGERIDKLCRAAELREAGLGDPRGAAELLERVVAEDPDRLETWRRLVQLHRLMDDPRKQREALLRVAELGDEQETIAALRKATRLAHEVLADPEAARMGWACLLEKLPEDGEALDGIIEIERQEGLDQALESHLAQRVEATGDPGLQARLLRERAALLVERLDLPAQAVDVLERLEKLLPRDGAVLVQLASLYQRLERWTDLSRVLGRQIELAGSERDRARLWLELAEVRQVRLDDPAGAVDALRKAAANDPEDRAPLEQLRRLAAANRDDALHIEALEALAMRSGDADEERDLRRAAGLLRWASGQKEDARKAFGRVLALDPDDPVARRLMARLQFEQNPAGAVDHIRWLLDHQDTLLAEDARLLRRQLVEALTDADPADRIQALEGLLRVVPDDLMAARQLADLYRETGSHRALADLLARMGDMVEEGTGAHLWIQRAEILLREGDHGAAAQALERALAIGGEHQYEVARRLARIQLHKLEDKPAAAASLERALELEPEDTSTLQQLSDLYWSMEDWRRAADVTARLIERVDAEDQTALQLRLGDIRLEQGLADEARCAFEAAIRLDPAHRVAYQRLEELQPEDDAQRAGFYLRWARSPAAGSRRVALFADAARLLGRTGETDQASDALQEALRLDPSGVVAHIRWLLEHPETLVDDDVCLLRRQLVEALADADPDERIDALQRLLEEVPDDLAAARQLADLYQETGRQRELADLLARMGDLVEEGTGAELWIQRAEILLGDDDPRAAARALERALAIEGDHRIEVAMRLAGIQLQDLQDRKAAAQSLERVLEIDPRHLAALQQLSDLAWSMEDWQRAAEITTRLIEQVDPGLQPGLQLRLGDIRLEQGLVDEARSAFDAAIELDPGYRVAYQRLEQNLPGDDDLRRANFYLRWARSPAAGSRRVGLLSDAARLLERNGENDEAIEALEEALGLDPANPGVCESLAPLLAREERWEKLLRVLQQRIETAEDDQRRFALAFEMGELCKEHLDDPGRAAVHFEQCLAIDPGNPAALEELADIHYARQDWKRAMQLYDELGERGLAAKRFVVAFRRGEMAEVLEDDESAVEHHRRSIRLNPTFIPARQNLIKLLGRGERYNELAEAIEGLLDVLPGEGFDDMELDLQRQLGRTRLRLLDFEQAQRWFRLVLEREPDDREAVRVLKNLAANTGRWEEAVDLARREIALVPGAPDAAERFEALGDMLLEGAGDSAAAAEAYREAIDHQPDDPRRVRWKLWDILRTGSDWAAVRSLGTRLLEEELDETAELPVRRLVGEACRRTGDTAGALEHLRRALTLGGGEPAFVEQVADLARAREQWSLYTSLAGQALEARLAQGLDPEDALERYLRLAGVYQEQLGDVTRAAAAIRRALELHPRDPELLRRLGNLYASDFETYREAIEVFRELIGMDPSDGELFRYLARLEAARGDADRTTCYYAGLRFLMPMDEEARKYLAYAGRVTAPARGLGRAEWDDIILHPAADCLLQRVMAVLAPYLEQLFPADLARFGVHGDQMVGPDAHPELAEAAERARNLVAGRSFSLFVVDQPAGAYRAWLESGGTPSIIISGAVVERSTPEELAFFVSREVAKVACGFVLPAKLSRSDLLQLLGLLCKIARPDTEPPVALPATAPQYLAAIREMVPQDVMEMVLPLIRRYALEPRAHDIDRWHTGLQRTADRMGLLCCGELNAALSVMNRESEAAGGRDLAFIPDRANLLARDQDMMALFRFSFSEPFLRLRRELGVVVKSS